MSAHESPGLAVNGSLWQSARMRVFVTGVAGFVGQRLEARLRAAGAQVIGTDLELDVGVAGRVAEAVAAARPDAIVHLAAISFVPAAARNPQAVYRVNFLGARSILEATQKISPGVRLLLVGSGHVYGSAEPDAPPFDESAPLRPDSSYAWSKTAGDLLGGFYENRGVDVVRVRPFNHTGHIAILKIRLVPEPNALAMLAAGAGALVLLRRSFHSSSSRRDFNA